VAQKALQLHDPEVLKDYEKFLKGLSQAQLKDCCLQEAGLKKEEDSSGESDSDGHDDDDDVQTVKMVLQERSRDQILTTPHQTVVVVQMT
jgi:hypothetical protein